MDYKQALTKISELTDNERIKTSHSQSAYSLQRISGFMDYIGNPHVNVPTIHIAGTKGKGSTANMIASILLAQGYKVGIFLSPHLHSFRERLMFGRDPITEEAFADLLDKVFSLSEEFTANSNSNQLTTYELLTAMALYGFSSERMDFQVLEVGLGGRLDATNVIKESMVSIITSISLDHTQILGDTLEQIASEKAGILKNNSLPLIAPQNDKVLKVIDDRCRDLDLKPIHVADRYSWEKTESDIDGQSFYFSDSDSQDEFRIPLLGKSQLENAGVAIATAKLLDGMGTKISHDAVKEGLRSVNWPGRLEVISKEPLLVVDGAHNAYSVELLSTAVREYFVFDNIIIVIGVATDKDLPNIVNGLVSLNPKIVATQSRHPRAERAEEVGRMFSEEGIDVLVVEEVSEAVNRALKMAGDNDLVLATGSLYVVSEVREEVKGIAREVYMKD